MNIWNDLSAANGTFFRFRRRHNSEILAGKAGVWALLRLHDFSEWSVLYVQASNDLGEIEGSRITALPVYEDALRIGCSAVAILFTGSLDETGRSSIAHAIASVNSPPLNPTLAA